MRALLASRALNTPPTRKDRWSGTRSGREFRRGRRVGQYGIESTLYDLSADPEELRPVARWEGAPGPETHAEIARLSHLLDELGPTLVDRRIWSEEDRRALSREDTDALRAIGYVR